jgi:glycosyltransferase involved in cell wall biosynthesis
VQLFLTLNNGRRIGRPDVGTEVEAAVKVMVLGIRGIPNVQGGVETHAEELYKRLAALGCEVEVLVRTPFVPRGEKAFGRIRIRRLWSPRRAGLEAFVHSILGVLYAGIVRPDVLHIHAIGPAIVTPIARLLRLKVVVTHHSLNYEHEKWGWFARLLLRAGERVGMEKSHARIAVSKTIVDMIRKKYGRAADLIPNGVAVVEPRHDDQHVRRYGLEPGRYFLMVSRIVIDKRQMDLIRAYALARPPNWKLVLVGATDSDEYSRLVNTAAEAAGVVLTGYLQGEALRQMYSHAGAFILPSSHEGLPIALLEALSYGLPVLASDIAANLEIGLDSSCYFPLGDIKALADGLTGVALAPRDEEMRANSRRWVAQKYDWNRIARQTLDVYRRVADGRAQAGDPLDVED